MLEKSLILFIVALLAGHSGSLSGQGQSEYRADKLDAVSASMRARLDMMDDPVPFDACTVYEQGGRPDSLISRLSPGLREFLDRPVNQPCAVPAPVSRPGNSRSVAVDSLVLGDSTGSVYLTVQRGEWMYRERHDLMLTANGRRWALRGVQVYPGTRITPSH
ncbi:hypothetical protein [Longimicrobium terrae]|uniref:Uncharacterized protein n=1 Tax=Longimicrobium terrae TaxID=1639882 RepID=A0A841GXL0_9BACT|nr:hypothetical protein [Longimicrobium terrae]MBB4636090.1 hypothetical protein [Longimicrobium terrae]MBB6070485.1 hypothetical protein [Longimicrobium terrae]NNC29476.1 hypothetical protein [Longimicrobium terrae]